MKNMNPYQLGETKSVKALEYLIVFLREGNDNEKRLAASAIGKIAKVNVDECYETVPWLISVLGNKKPQVRNYSLKTLDLLKLSDDDKQKVSKYYSHEDKDYNILYFRKIMNINDEKFYADNVNILPKFKENTINSNSHRPLKIGDSQHNTAKTFLMSNIEENVKENITEAIVITVIINGNRGYLLKGSNIISMLKGAKWPIIENYKQHFHTYGLLKDFQTSKIKSVYESLLKEEIIIEEYLSFRKEKRPILSYDYENIENNPVWLRNIVECLELNECRGLGVLTQGCEDQLKNEIVLSQSFDKFCKKSHAVDLIELDLIVNRCDISMIKSSQTQIEAANLVNSFLKIINDIPRNSDRLNRGISMLNKRCNGFEDKLLTYRDIAGEYNLSRERVRQILNKEIERIRAYARKHFAKNEDYLNFREQIFGHDETINYFKLITTFLELYEFYTVDKCSLIVFTLYPIKNYETFVKWIKKHVIEESDRRRREKEKGIKNQEKLQRKISEYDQWILDKSTIYSNSKFNSKAFYYSLNNERIVDFDKENTGVFHCDKMNKGIQYESNLEYKILKRVSLSNEIVSYKVQSLKIPYLYEGKVKYFYPDVQVLTKNGFMIIIEIKPTMHMIEYLNLVKFQALDSFCRDRGIGYIVLDDRRCLNDIYNWEINETLCKTVLCILDKKPFLTYTDLKEIVERRNFKYRDLYPIILRENLKLMCKPYYKLSK